MFTSLARLLGPRSRRGGRGRPARRPTSSRLSCEALERREVLSTFGEFHVNTVAQNHQYDSANASSANGRSVAVWRHQYSDTDADIHAQIYNADGSPFGSEITVTADSRNETEPAVAMDAAGNFVVTWTLQYNSNDRDVRAALFSANGIRINNAISVVASGLNEYESSVAMADNGSFVVAYTLDRTYNDPDVMVRMFSASGYCLREIATYNSAYLGYATPDHHPSVASSSDGRFTVAFQRGWSDNFVNRSLDSDIYVNRYDSSGNRLSLQRMNETTRSDAYPSVSMDGAGNSVVAYQSLVGGDWDIYARRISNYGALGAEMVIAATSNDEYLPSVALDTTNARYVVAYQSPSGVEVREVSAYDYVGGPFFVYGAFSTAISMSRDYSHRYLLTYTGNSYGWSDPGYGIFGRFGSLAY